MNASNLNTVDQLKAFLDGNQPIAFAIAGNKHDRYPYDLMMTPYEKFKSLPNSKNHLPTIIKRGVTFAILDALACQQSDNDAAEQLQKAKQHLFNLIYEQQEQLA